MPISKTKTSQKLLICGLLDTRMSTSILSYHMAKELRMDIRSGDHIILKTASGEEMDVKEVGSIWLDLYECKYERNKFSSRKRIEVITSDSLDGDKDLLISRGSMYKLLLPINWPFYSESTEIITSNLSKEEAQEIII